jgi:hypothetical protein
MEGFMKKVLVVFAIALVAGCFASRDPYPPDVCDDGCGGEGGQQWGTGGSGQGGAGG